MTNTRDQEGLGRSWASWTSAFPRRVLDEVLEAPSSSRTSERERDLMRRAGWESMQRLGRSIWRHAEHTGGSWTSEDVARQWARDKGDWPASAAE